MGVSKKTLVVVASIFVCILIAVFFYLRFFVLANYMELEKAQVTDKIIQSVKILNRNISSAEKLTYNYSLSNDAYGFLSGSNENYADNLSGQMFENLDIGIFAMVGNDKNLKYGTYYEAKSSKFTGIPENIKEIITGDDFLAGSSGYFSGLSGVLVIDNVPYILISKPVTGINGTSDNSSASEDNAASGPAGTVIIARQIDSDMVETITNELRNPVSFLDLSNTSIASDFDSIISGLAGGSSYDIEYMSQDEVNGFTIIKDINLKPALLLKITMPRSMYLEGRNNVYSFFILLVFIGIVSCLTIFISIEKLVLSRIVTLSARAEEIGKEKDLNKNIPFKGRDEVAKLAISINRMLRDLKINELDIIKSEKRFRDLVQLLPEIVIETDREMRIRFANLSFFEVLGYDETDISNGLYISQILIQEDFKKAKDRFILLSKGSKTESTEYTAIKKDGTLFPILVSSVPIYDENNNFNGFKTIAVDITNRKKEEEKLRELEERWQFALEGSGDGVWDWNFKTNKAFYSKKLKEILGYGENEFANKFSEIKDKIHPEDVVKVMDNINRHVSGETPYYTAEYRIRKKDGSYMWALDRGKVIRWDENNNPSRMIGTFTDISIQKHLEEEIKLMAFRDPLTKLPNRLLFNDRIEVAIAHAKRYNRIFAIIIIDIDKFKKINDTYGHDIGDKLILHVGNTINSILRKTDTIARFGGDEFLLLLPDIKTIEDAERIASKIIDFFQEKALIGGKKISITLSMGIAIYPQDGEDISTLLKNADLALYEVKESGRNNYRFYEPKKIRQSI